MICKHKSTKLNSFKFTDNSMELQTFAYAQLNYQKILLQTIQFSISQS